MRAMVCAAALWLTVAGVSAQAPKLDEADALAIQVVQVSARLANSECAALPSVKDYQNLQREASARFAKKYPEFDVDFVKGTLSPKKK